MASCSGIDIEVEQLIELRAVTRLPAFRRDGKNAHISSVYRWVNYGAKDRAGNLVRLESIKTPSGSITSREAINRFLYRLSNPGAAPPRVTAKQQKRQLQQAEQELAAMGV